MKILFTRYNGYYCNKNHRAKGIKIDIERNIDPQVCFQRNIKFLNSQFLNSIIFASWQIHSISYFATSVKQSCS